jgi:hypothetical protein
MKFTDILNESLYNVELTSDKIYNKFFAHNITNAKSNNLSKSNNFDATEYLKAELSKLKIRIIKWKLFVSMKYKDKVTKYGVKAVTDVDKENKTIKITIFFDDKYVRSKFFKEQLLDHFKHELVHVIDYFRGKKEFRIPDDYEKNYSGYLNSDLEFNALIHEINYAIKRNKKTWNKITNQVELKNYLLVINSDLKALKKESEDEFNKYYLKVLKRLSRENLLPQSMRENNETSRNS